MLQSLGVEVFIFLSFGFGAGPSAGSGQGFTGLKDLQDREGCADNWLMVRAFGKLRVTTDGFTDTSQSSWRFTDSHLTDIVL